MSLKEQEDEEMRNAIAASESHELER